MKSLGRLARSVAMITHRPVIGSLRSSGNVGESSGDEQNPIIASASTLRSLFQRPLDRLVPEVRRELGGLAGQLRPFLVEGEAPLQRALRSFGGPVPGAADVGGGSGERRCRKQNEKQFHVRKVRDFAAGFNRPNTL